MFFIKAHFYQLLLTFVKYNAYFFKVSCSSVYFDFKNATLVPVNLPS